jgi:hypothetical protein
VASEQRPVAGVDDRAARARAVNGRAPLECAVLARAAVVCAAGAAPDRSSSEPTKTSAATVPMVALTRR